MAGRQNKGTLTAAQKATLNIAVVAVAAVVIFGWALPKMGEGAMKLVMQPAEDAKVRVDFMNHCRAVEDDAGRKPVAGDPQYVAKHNAYQKAIFDCTNTAIKQRKEQATGK
jgi:hypothetical protein